MKFYKSKVCIIGGGPAGATASLFLSKFKVPHILIDSAHFPRDKVCGESFDGRVTRILKELSEHHLEKLHETEIIRNTWNYSLNKENLRIPISFSKNNTPRLLSKRIDFDNYLFQEVKKSGFVTLIENEHIKNFSRSGSGIILTNTSISVESELALIASGANSILGMMDIFPKNNHLIFRSYFKGVQSMSNNEFEIHFMNLHSSNLTITIAPISKDECNVEIGISKKHYCKSYKNAQEIFNHISESESALAKRFLNAKQQDKFKGAPIRFDKNKLRIAENKIIFIGDSSYSVNPLTGLGVGNAMKMGYLSAKHIQQNFFNDNFSNLTIKNYKKDVIKKFRNVVILNYLLNILLKYPQVTLPLLFAVRNTRFLNYILHESDLVRKTFNPNFYLNFLWRSR